MINQQQLWDEEAAEKYDTPGEGMFSPEVLGPTLEVLSKLAGDGPAVEFAIGTGRVAIPLSKAGVHVSGIELSHAMISRLREKDGAEAIHVVQGDMTEAVAGDNFSLAFLVFNTIANLLTQEDQVRCFQNAARHLAPGGRFVIELWVPQLRSLPPGHQGTVEVSRPGYLLVDTYDVLNQHVISHHVGFGPELSDGRVARIGRTPHRYIWPSELDLMAQLAGFELESRWADWDGSDFTGESRSHVSVYRLPAS
ncbi:methyltransferase domain-containing protein [Arthrobacter sp. Hor0625]|uniref:methyltransferase domain-containing protein n=1 Tax=Arthrobacter sp. Hor0625 TaxID=3457358 RepID=UPI00403EE8C5